MRLPEDDVGNVIQPGDRAFERSGIQMVDGTILFTISGGPVDVLIMHGRCVTANSSLATTFAYNFIPDVGSAQLISGVSSTMENILAGSAIDLIPTTLTTQPRITLAGSGGLYIHSVANRLRLPEGKITCTLGTSSITGTWDHYIRYAPISPGASVS